MTREETKKILMGIQCSYPNFKPQVPLEFMLDIWADDLAEYSYQQVYTALKTFKTTDKSGFAPSVGQIIDKIHIVQEMPNDKTETAIWGSVMKALRNSTYNAEIEFADLDEISQKVLGSPSALRQMASDTDFNEAVEKSHFIKQYRLVVERNKQLARMPKEVRTAIAQKQTLVIEKKGVNNG